MPVCGETTASSRGSATSSGVGWTGASSGTRGDLLEPRQRCREQVHLGAGRAAGRPQDAVTGERERDASIERVERAGQGWVEAGEIAEEGECGDAGDERLQGGRAARGRRHPLQRPQLLAALAGRGSAQPVTGETRRLTRD